MNNNSNIDANDSHRNKNAIVRPKNSLLSTYLDFDYSDKLKPTITEDLTNMIENLIINKIKNDDFDDVEQKFDFVRSAVKPKRKLIEISDQKSSMGLAELYERQYLQQVASAQQLSNMSKNDASNNSNGNEYLTEEEIKKHKKYEQISRMKGDLFYSLDQLTRFHYTPRAAVMQSNIKVATHTKALFLEETLPFTHSNAMDGMQMTMAPEQIYKKPVGKFMVGTNEMDRNEKQKKRRENKKRSMDKKRTFEVRDKERAKYDMEFAKHLDRMKALNEVRMHTMAAAKKDGMIKSDNTKYTSSLQMFTKIENAKKEWKEKTERNKNFGMMNKDDWKKKRKLMITNKDEWNVQAPNEKRRKVSQLRS